jgi:carbamoyl-phosphate synthase small subunit
MKYTQRKPAILMLQDGTVFRGHAAGFIGTTTGEICFNTGMTGYQEVYTDPSYYGQILVNTTAHIGNYGVNKNEVESDSVKISGLVCRNFSEFHSRTDSEGSLQQYFEKEKIVAICDVDTRAIVRYIRNKGVMNAVISSEIMDENELKKILDKVPSMEGLELSSKVATKEAYYWGNENAKYKVAALDLGIKRSILSCLAERDCYVKVFPMNSTLEDMKAFNPDGYFISNGPGDPASLPHIANIVKQIVDMKAPLFGICLGHQILSKAMGLSTYKMHNGHRGLNHPIKNLITGKGEITSQNHGFVVNMDEAIKHENIIITHKHLNDGTLAGIKVKDKPAFSVQYHPEASAGPHDSRYLFDDFVSLMEKVKVLA